MSLSVGCMQTRQPCVAYSVARNSNGFRRVSLLSNDLENIEAMIKRRLLKWQLKTAPSCCTMPAAYLASPNRLEQPIRAGERYFFRRFAHHPLESQEQTVPA